MNHRKNLLLLCGLTWFCGLGPIPSAWSQVDSTIENEKKLTTQKIRLVEDDAQNYMVSKVYELKYQKANDLVPFILGAVKRYAQNSTADRINYSAGHKQLITISCPAPMLHYVDDMIAKLDRQSLPSVDGSQIEGTGISRSVYYPQYRSSQKMVDIMIAAGISSNASAGANQDATVAFDPGSNIIYWKDSKNKDKDLKKYLAWLDRPVPQIGISINIYEVRESDLMDLGIDYLAWKNGPGLNLFEAGSTFIEDSALESAFGPYGFFAFAPSFDFSFIRMLQQNGHAQLFSSSKLILTNNHDGTLTYVPTFQNLTKDSKFASAVNPSYNDNITLKINKPIVSLNGACDKNGLLGYSNADIAEQLAVVNFGYDLKMRNVVERNNLGDELYEESAASSFVSVQNGSERMLARWTRESTVEQTVGVPYLSEMPILKYIFGTTTFNTEKQYYFLSVSVELIGIDADVAQISSKLLTVDELIKISELKENK